jgi:hypothetical protein
MKSKKNLILAVSLAGLLCVPASPAWAADEEVHLSFEELLATAQAKEKLDPGVRLFLRGQKTPRILEKKGEDVSNRKTNGFGKEATTSCQWAALSALMALQDKARRLGGNAVVDIVSFYKRDASASATNYECHVGHVVSGVSFKGTIATVAP